MSSLRDVPTPTHINLVKSFVGTCGVGGIHYSSERRSLSARNEIKLNK